MSQSRKRRGADTQRLVARAMATDGWPYAEAIGAGQSGADITGTPGVSIEVKARRGLSLGEWLRQAVRQAADGEVPVLVIRLDGQGPATVDDWPAVLPFAVLRRILRDAGYGDPTTGGTVNGTWLDDTDGSGRAWLTCRTCEARYANASGRSLVDMAAAHTAHLPGCPGASATSREVAA